MESPHPDRRSAGVHNFGYLSYPACSDTLSRTSHASRDPKSFVEDKKIQVVEGR